MSHRLPALKSKDVLRKLQGAGSFVHHKRGTLAPIIEQSGHTAEEFPRLH